MDSEMENIVEAAALQNVGDFLTHNEWWNWTLPNPKTKTDQWHFFFFFFFGLQNRTIYQNGSHLILSTLERVLEISFPLHPFHLQPTLPQPTLPIIMHYYLPILYALLYACLFSYFPPLIYYLFALFSQIVNNYLLVQISSHAICIKKMALFKLSVNCSDLINLCIVFYSNLQSIYRKKVFRLC